MINKSRLNLALENTSLSFRPTNPNPRRYIVYIPDEHNTIEAQITREEAGQGFARIHGVDGEIVNGVMSVPIPNGFTIEGPHGEQHPVGGFLILTWNEGGILKFNNIPVATFKNQKQLSYTSGPNTSIKNSREDALANTPSATATIKISKLETLEADNVRLTARVQELQRLLANNDDNRGALMEEED